MRGATAAPNSMGWQRILRRGVVASAVWAMVGGTSALPSAHAQVGAVPTPPDPCTFGTRNADYGTIPSCHRIDDERHLAGWQTLGWAYYCPDNTPFLAHWTHTGDGVSVTYNPFTSAAGSVGHGAKIDLTMTNWDPFAGLSTRISIACSPMPTNTAYDVGNPVPAPSREGLHPLPGSYEKLCAHDKDVTACTYAEGFYRAQGGDYVLYYRVTVEGTAQPTVNWFHVGNYAIP